MKYLRALLYCFSTLLIYLGTPLLGWGPGSLAGFFSNQSRAGYALVVLAFGLAVGVQAVNAPEGIRGGKGDETKRVRRQGAVRIILLFFLYAMLLFLPFADRRALAVWGENPAVRWLGVALSALGYALVFLSGLALGKQYSPEVTIQPGHRLITGGVFRFIRHPRYLGLMLAACGVSCVFRSWAGLAAGAFLAAVLLFRIRDEEALLRREFGQEWEEYCKTSWRLIPFIF